MSNKYSFEATLKDAGPGTGGAYIIFPYDVQEAFGSNGRIPVTATIDGQPYRGSLVKYGEPMHMLLVLKSIRARIGKQPGDTVSVTIERDLEKREVELPRDLKKALASAKLEEVFSKLSYTHQREYVTWLEAAKKAETRASRLEKALHMIQQKAANK